MRIFSLAVILALVAAACGGAVADKVAEQIVEQAAEETGGAMDFETSGEDGFTMTFEDEEGTVSQGGLGGSLPEDFPFPLPDEYEVGMNVRTDGDAGTGWLATIQVPGDQVEAMKEMYQTWLEEQGFKLEIVDLGNWYSMQGTGDGVDAMVDISLDEVANDDAGNLIYATTISRVWGPEG